VFNNGFTGTTQVKGKNTRRDASSGGYIRLCIDMTLLQADHQKLSNTEYARLKDGFLHCIVVSSPHFFSV